MGTNWLGSLQESRINVIPGCQQALEMPEQVTQGSFLNSDLEGSLGIWALQEDIQTQTSDQVVTTCTSSFFPLSLSYRPPGSQG